MVRLEVAHADGAHLAVHVERLQRSPGVRVRLLPLPFGALGRRPMDKVEVHVVQMQLLARLFERLQRGVVAAVGVPHLRGDEQLLARYAGHGERLAHRRLVVVGRRRVDVAVPVGQRLVQRVEPHFPVRHLPGTESHAGYPVAVAQRNAVLHAFQMSHVGLLIASVSPIIGRRPSHEGPPANRCETVNGKGGRGESRGQAALRPQGNALAGRRPRKE